MSFRGDLSYDDLRRIEKIEGMLGTLGIKLGDFLGAGTQGWVFKGPPGTVYKITPGDSEYEVAARIVAMGDLHPSVARIHNLWRLPDPIWGTHKAFGYSVVQREFLTFDHDRSEALLEILSYVEIVTLYGAPQLAKSQRPPEFFIDALVADAAKRDDEAYDDVKALLTDANVKGALSLLGAMQWLYRNGVYVGDIWAVGLGRGYGTKPENIGFRGATPVIADYGIWKAVTP